MGNRVAQAGGAREFSVIKYKHDERAFFIFAMHTVQFPGTVRNKGVQYAARELKY